MCHFTLRLLCSDKLDRLQEQTILLATSTTFSFSVIGYCACVYYENHAQWNYWTFNKTFLRRHPFSLPLSLLLSLSPSLSLSRYPLLLTPSLFLLFFVSVDLSLTIYISISLSFTHSLSLFTLTFLLYLSPLLSLFGACVRQVSSLFHSFWGSFYCFVFGF